MKRKQANNPDSPVPAGAQRDKPESRRRGAGDPQRCYALTEMEHKDSTNMKDKVAIITGGTSGFGKGTAELLAAKGVKVVLSARRKEVGEQIASDIRANGGEAIFTVTDVNDEASVEALVATAVAHYGRLDLAVNNAGISTEGAKLGDSETARFQEMIQTNVLGVYFGMKFQIRQMLKNGGGSIVNLASIAGLNGIPYTSAYCASKHAVVGLTKAGALDYANDAIRINAVAPGAAKTEIIVKAMTQGVYDEASISAMHPMNRMGTAQEIVNGIVWLLSDEASFVTGHILNIDGGFQAK
jgi:NAD(P)-dependent dehydrogenase (short-subunit alcohol dehydrogenase family)